MMLINNTCPEWAEIVKEGLAKICAPKKDLFLRKDGVYEPAWAPVFYNPIMSMNRDFTILAINILSRTHSIKSASDLMAATGVRGIRIALECSSVDEIYMNDIDPRACRIIEGNAKINNVLSRIRLYCEDFHVLSRSLVKSGVKIDFNDIDPYGSPAPYVSSAIDLTKRNGFISFTATDIGSLAGTYPHKTLKRYGSYVIKTDFSREIGLRVLLGHIARVSAEKNYGIKPLISYYADHYYKTIITINRGSTNAINSLKKTGFYRYCEKCGYREAVFYEEFIGAGYSSICPICGSKMISVGPLWLGELWDKEFIHRSIESADSMNTLENKERVKNILARILNEADVEIPYYYSIDYVASRLRLRSPPLKKLIECLSSAGYIARRTHLDPKGVRTNAGYRDLVECIKISSQN